MPFGVLEGMMGKLTAFDVWTLAHIVSGILLGVVVPLRVVYLVPLAWEIWENVLNSCWENWVNVLSDLIVTPLGIWVGFKIRERLPGAYGNRHRFLVWFSES